MKPQYGARCTHKRDCPTGQNHRHACTLKGDHGGRHEFVEPCELHQANLPLPSPDSPAEGE
jgi:hypothetical protein